MYVIDQRVNITRANQINGTHVNMVPYIYTTGIYHKYMHACAQLKQYCINASIDIIFIYKFKVMAKGSKGGSGTSVLKKTTKKRPGIHSKSKSSKIKSSKNYKKKNIGQG